MTEVMGVSLTPTSYPDVVIHVFELDSRNKGGYVCVANVHMVMEAYDSPEFRDVVNDADLVVSDGMPLVWMMRMKGQGDQQRVYGPLLMLKLLDVASKENVSVGFYGGKREVLNILVKKMQHRYPDLNVAYSYSPPFRDLSVDEDKNIIEDINDANVGILLVGLGCPKQEMWMAEHRDKVNSVMIGVGAAFDFHAGVKPQAPTWMQIAGLEWLFRLFTEPRRLWKRYLYHNPRFVFLAVMDLFDHYIRLKSINQ